MKFTIDTERKEITATHDVKIREIVNFLKEKFPEDWGEYKFCIADNISVVPIYVEPLNPTWTSPTYYRDTTVPIEQQRKLPYEVTC